MKPRIIFAGTPEFALASLDALAEWCAKGGGELVAVYSRADKPSGRGRRITASPVKQRAQELGLPVEQPPTLRNEVTQSTLRRYAPDLMVVAAYGLLLPTAVLEMPRFGCINVHASLLPRWRGAAPIHRAIVAGDAQTGITIMQMDKGLDTGAMWLKRSMPIDDNDTGGSLHDKLAILGGQALVAALPPIIAQQGVPEAQDDALATYAKKLEKSEARLDWRRPAAELARKVRAFSPWPVAESTLDGRVIRIWEAQAMARNAQDAAPGSVVAQHSDCFEVVCGQGSLSISAVQLPGKRPMPVKDFLNAHSMSGKVLGRPA